MKSEVIINYKNKKYKVNSNPIKNAKLIDKNTLAESQRKVEHILQAQEDSGASTILTMITTAKLANKSFKAAQAVVATTPKLVKIAKGTYRVGNTLVKVVNSKNTAMELHKVTRAYISNLKITKRIRYVGVQMQRTGRKVVKTAHRIERYSHAIQRGARRAIVLSNGIINGTIRVKVSKETINRIRNATIKKGIKLGKYTVKTAITKGIRTGIKTGKVLDKGLVSASNMLANTQDMGAQALGDTVKVAHYTIKSLSYAPIISKRIGKGVKTGVKIGVKTGKAVRGVGRGIDTISRFGVQNSFKIYSRKLTNKFRAKAPDIAKNASKKISRGITNIIKSAIKKIIAPLLLIILIMMFASGMISSAVAAVGSVLSPFISDDSGKEVDETSWLISHITTKRNDLIQEIKDTYNANLIINGGNFHYVRFFNAFNDSEIELTDENITTSIYSVSEYLQYIQPIFHTIILSEYDMEASDEQMETVLDEIWDKLTIVKTEELPMEYCNAGVKESDGYIHADLSTCPNYSELSYHDDNVASGLCSCDYWYFTCNGHQGGLICGKIQHMHYEGCYLSINGVRTLICTKEEHTHTDSCYDTYYHSGELASSCSNCTRHKGCNGYCTCNGHKILSLTIELGRFGDLLDNYFLDEINTLQSMETLTTEEQQRLQQVQDYYDICVNYMAILEQELGYGNNGVIVDLDGVTLTEITSYACSFVGNPYVWGGNDPHTGADCSGFVRYVYAHFGVSLPRTAHEIVTCGQLVPSLSEALPGDLLFWGESGTDSGVTHVAMYLGDGKIVHAANSKPYPQGGIKIGYVYGTVYKIKRMVH